MQTDPTHNRGNISKCDFMLTSVTNRFLSTLFGLGYNCSTSNKMLTTQYQLKSTCHNTLSENAYDECDRNRRGRCNNIERFFFVFANVLCHFICCVFDVFRFFFLSFGPDGVRKKRFVCKCCSNFEIVPTVFAKNGRR